MLTEAERSFLLSHSICRLATVDSQGQPHNVPVGYALEGDTFYISSDPGTKKLRNIAENPRVCLVVDEVQKPRKCVMIQGKAELIDRGAAYQAAMRLMAQQRGWKPKAEGEQVVIKIKAEKKVSWGL